MGVREAVETYIRQTYGIEADHPLPSAPWFPVFRHPENRKWFALIMDAPGERLGLSGSGRVDLVNLKTTGLREVGFLCQQEGFFPGYHLNRGGWISILLDGTVPFEVIKPLVDQSFRVTGKGWHKQEDRPAKDWLVPANPKYFDIVHGFDETDTLTWRQGADVRKGDHVFIYVGSLVFTVLYACLVIEAGLPRTSPESSPSIKKEMVLKLEKRFDPKRFTRSRLIKEYGVTNIRSARSIPHSLSVAFRRAHGSGTLG